jgi:hypothetical protein
MPGPLPSGLLTGPGHELTAEVLLDPGRAIRELGVRCRTERGRSRGAVGKSRFFQQPTNAGAARAPASASHWPSKGASH